MGKIEELINEEIMMLESIAKSTKERMKKAPKGHLRISNKKGRIEYYHKEIGDIGNGKYIKKKDKELAQRIAQNEYDRDVMTMLDERVKQMSHFLELYNKTDLSKIYDDINEYRKALIYAPMLSDEQYAEMWSKVSYVGKTFDESIPEIITERGERVRSKSEKIIADKLYLMGIPYRYEYPLRINENIVIYPDFTILKPGTRKEIYLEHFGMMDDKEYMENFIYKLNTYERNGIYPGVNLFFTHETSKQPLNTRVLDGMLKSMFCS